MFVCLCVCVCVCVCVREREMNFLSVGLFVHLYASGWDKVCLSVCLSVVCI